MRFLLKNCLSILSILMIFSPAHALDVESLSITSSDGTVHVFNVEIAREESDKQKGLMQRESLDDNKGMLFEFSPPQLVSMWMKNTIIPLDMIFIKKNGEIARISEQREPFSEMSIASGSVVSAVLEIRGGRARALGIKAGDKVTHPFFLQK